MTYELHVCFHTSYGDANLDRATELTDFDVLLEDWCAQGDFVGWSMGDFNGDKTVDFQDFQILLVYWNPMGWD